MKKLLLFLFALVTMATHAQTPGDIAQNFGRFPGFLIGNIYTTTTQIDGKILVAGQSFQYNGINESSIIRLNTDGTKDSSFNIISLGFNGAIWKIVTQTDGKILVGGQFTSYDGVSQNRIIRLNADGTKDSSFNIGTGFNNTVNVITTQADGKILIGGRFTTYNGITEYRIIRLNADGTKDSSFNSGLGVGGEIHSIAFQTDGKILIGNFRLNPNGSIDTSFNTGTGFDNNVYSIAIQSDGKILVGGSFNFYNQSVANRFTRLNSDGTKDSSFNAGTGFSDTVYCIAKQSDGKILVGGSFMDYKGVNERFIIRLNTDGSKDTSFDTGTGFNGIVLTIAIQPDGKILVGGVFNNYKGVTESKIIRLNADGSKDTSFNTGTGFNNNVSTIAIQTDGKILVGGYFTSYNGVNENKIIRLNNDGTKDISFNTGTGFGNVNYLIVSTIVVQTDGKILVGGNFDSYKGITSRALIRLNSDGTKDTSFDSGIGFNLNARVYVITLQHDGKILVGGGFVSYNGVSDSNIIRLNSDGTKDTSFNTGTGFSHAIFAIKLQSDEKILAGGEYTTYNGVNESGIIRLNSNGTKDSSFNTGIGLDSGFAYAISLTSEGKILVGGYFTTYKGSAESAFLIGLHTEQSLGTPNFNDSNTLIMYPNPVKDVLNFQSNNFTTIKAVKIYDLQGKLILESANETINVSHITNGLYLAKISTEEGEVTKKFIKE